MVSVTESSADRADRLLQDVLGADHYRRLRTLGYIDLPSRRQPGRTYRIDNLGNLSYRDPGEGTFNTTLCVQPEETIPRDDQIAMRYLLVTADEERLLQVANPITFGFVSLTRALHHDFSRKFPAVVATLFTAMIVGFFLGAIGIEVWALLDLLPDHPVAGALCFLMFLAPAFIGVVLVVAACVEVVRLVNGLRARRQMQRAGLCS
jgi:hypothetical protein